MSREKHNRALVAGIIAGVVVLAGVLWYLLRPAAVPRVSVEQAKQARPQAIAPGLENRESDAEFAARVQPAALAQDEKGNLVLGPQFIEIFDAFRSRFIGKGEEAMFASFAAWAEERYSADEARYITEIFRKYIEYLRALSDPAFFAGKSDLATRHAATKELRERIFGKEVADILFAGLDRRFEIAVQLDAINRDASLTHEEKLDALAKLKSSLSPEEQESFFPSNPHLDYRVALGKLRADESLSPEELAAKTRKLREGMFGAEAADRLEALDAERAARVDRIGEYWREAEKVEFDESLNEEERAARLDALKKEHLTEEDIRRMEAREAVEQMEKLGVSDVAEQIRAEQNGESAPLDWDTPAQRGENIGVQDAGEPSSP